MTLTESGRLLIFTEEFCGSRHAIHPPIKRIMKATIAIAVGMLILVSGFVYYISRGSGEIADTVEQFKNFDAKLQASSDAELKKSQLRIGQIILGTDSPELRQYARCLDNVALSDKDKMLCRSLQEEINSRIKTTHKW